MPHLEELTADLKDRDFVVLAVNSQDPGEKVGKFFETEKYSFRPLLQKDHAVSKAYRVVSYPTNYLIGPDGKIRERVVAPLVDETLREFVESALPKK